MEISSKILSEIIVFSKYARFLPSKNRRETWEEIVERNCAMHIRKFPGLEEEIRKNYQLVLDKRVIPSARSLQFAGKAIELNNARIFNCSAVAMSDWRAFGEVMFLLLSGCGVGISTQTYHIEQLPAIRKPTSRKRRYVVEDSIMGWSDAIKSLMKSYFFGTSEYVFDFSDIRPAGAPLITSGGAAPGPQPLMDCIHNIKKALNSTKDGEKLTSLQVHEIVCHICNSVLSGGIRRSSCLSAFNLDDNELLTSKNGRWWDDKPHLGRANNSAVLVRHKVKREDFDNLWEVVKNNKTGEPGFIWSSNAENYACNPCLVGETLVAVADGKNVSVSIKELAESGKDIPVYCLDNNDQVVVRTMRNPRITGFKQPIYKISLDNGEHIRATSNHKLLTLGKGYVKVEDLTEGTSLCVMSKHKSSIKEIFPKISSNSQDYWWLSTSLKARNTSEHRAIYKFHNGCEIKEGNVIHHKNYNGLDNDPKNLEMMSKGDHDILHSQNMFGDKNPMRRAKYEWSEEKWRNYKNKHSINNAGQNNSRYCGVDNDQLLEQVKELTLQKQNLVSTGDWIAYAKTRGLPTKFTKWRMAHFGGIGIGGFCKLAAIELGFLQESDRGVDTRTIKRKNDFLREGYDCDIVNKKIIFHKRCEVCDSELDTQNREVGFCVNCSYEKLLEEKNKFRVADTENKITYNMICQKCSTIFITTSFRRIKCDDCCKLRKIGGIREGRREKLRSRQALAYIQTRSDLGRAPQKKEWILKCKEEGISFEISRKTSPFRNYDALRCYADGLNHKVVKVELDGYEDVYNGTVDEFHNFFVGGFKEQTKSGKDKFVFVNNLQCGEASLKLSADGAGSMCNLTEINMELINSQEDFNECSRVASFLGTLQASYTDFFYLRESWRRNTERDGLLGVGITGIANGKIYDLDFEEAAEEVKKENKRVAKMIGIRPAARTTVIKPAGSSSILLMTSSGIHPWFAPYYVRRMRLNKSEPLYRYIVKEIPELLEDDFEKPHFGAVLSVPIKAPNNAICRKDETALQFLERVKYVYKNWIKVGHIKGDNTHSVSCTVSVKESEWSEVGEWLWTNKDNYASISVIPYDNDSYKQMPFEEISRDKYEEMMRYVRKIDLTRVVEIGDNTTQQQEQACAGGSCEVKQI